MLAGRRDWQGLTHICSSAARSVQVRKTRSMVD
jgi:hypothetical protein